jgi:hypothetical protein
LLTLRATDGFPGKFIFGGKAGTAFTGDFNWHGSGVPEVANGETDIVRSRKHKLNSTVTLFGCRIEVEPQTHPASCLGLLSNWQIEKNDARSLDHRSECKLLSLNHLRISFWLWRATCLSSLPITGVRSNGSLEGR